MKKDPAFLFYSRDFYEGTRTMLPEERACYIDLLIYQHQNGIIPNDFKRMSMYCSGVNEAMLEATLKAKFKLSDKGWINEKLSDVILEREKFSNKQSINGVVGQFWKKAGAILDKKTLSKLREALSSMTINDIYKEILSKEINKAMLEAMLEAKLEAKLKHLANANANANEDVIVINKESVFKESCFKFEKNYPKEMILKFFNYWSEKDSRGKMKYEKQETFEIAKRLVTWKNNESEFKSNKVGTKKESTNGLEYRPKQEGNLF